MNTEMLVHIVEKIYKDNPSKITESTQIQQILESKLGDCKAIVHYHFSPSFFTYDDGEIKGFKSIKIKDQKVDSSNYSRLG